MPRRGASSPSTSGPTACRWTVKASRRGWSGSRRPRATRWRVPVEISRDDLEALVDRSAVVLEEEKHRLVHGEDWRRWGSRGGRETLRLRGGLVRAVGPEAVGQDHGRRPRRGEGAQVRRPGGGADRGASLSLKASRMASNGEAGR